MRTLVSHGTIVTASETFAADVVIDDERIAAIGASLAVAADRTIDAAGIETRLSLIYDAGVRAGGLSVNRFVDVVATAPARVFGLFPKKSVTAPGADADLVVFDPHRTMRLSAATGHSRADVSLYEGREVTWAADIVISRGQLVFERGRLSALQVMAASCGGQAR